MECFGIAESRGEKRLVYAENKPWHTVIVLQTDYESQMYINTDIAKQYARSALSSIVIMLMLVDRAGFFRYGTWGKSYSNMMQWAVFWLNGNCLKVCPCSVLLYFLSKRSDYLVLLAIWHLATTQSHQRMDQNKIYQNKNVYTRSERTSERANKWANHTHICFVGRGRSKTIIFINCSINSIIDFRTNRIYVVNGISLMCDVNFVFYAVN